VVKDPNKFPNSTPLVLINPRIESRSNKKQTMREGCLSFPAKTRMRRRSSTVRITAYDVNGEKFKWQAKGLAAQCIQHEIDHLNGKTFMDR
jgi:peptide deformylase